MLKAIFLSLLLIPSIAIGASSSENLANKKYEFTLQYGGDYRLTPTQFSAMYFLNKDNLVGLKIGSADYGDDEKQTNIALQYKYYAGNSFYVAAETFYLNTREDINGFWGGIFLQREYASYTSLGAGIRIGNQWTWKHFTLGCDWIGVGQRFGTFTKETDKLNDATFTLLNVIVGASF